MRSARVFFLNRFYWPDETATAQLLHDLTTALASRGFQVVVVTSQSEKANTPRFEDRDGVRICRVRTTRLGRGSLLGRVFDFLTYYTGAMCRLAVELRPGDVIVPMTDPPLLGACAWVIAHCRRAVTINWVQDVYPEVAIALTRHSWLRLSRPWRNRAWRSSFACVVPGLDMKRTVLENAVPSHRVVVSPNWAPAGVQVPDANAVESLRAKWELSGKFVVMYSGNLGRVHDLHPLIGVAELLRDEAGIVFLFVGHGAHRVTLESAAKHRGLTNVMFRPPQPRHDLSVSLAVGDVHLVTLLPGAEQWVFPSKLYGLTQAGRPTIFIGNTESEIARLIVQNDIGVAFSRHSPSAIVEAIRRLKADEPRLSRMRSAALRFSAGNLDAAIGSWQQLLTDGLAAGAADSAYQDTK